MIVCKQLIIGIALATMPAHAGVLFHTDFASELGGSTTSVAPATGNFETAKENSGTFYKSKAGVAFVSAAKAPNWPAPPDTAGAAAARLGYAYDDDFQLRLALSRTWSASSNYTLTVRHRSWTKTGATDGTEKGQLGMTIGTYEGAADWLASRNNMAIGSKDWVTTVLNVSGADVLANGSGGKQIVIRLQNTSGGTTDAAVWVDSIKVTAAAIK